MARDRFRRRGTRELIELRRSVTLGVGGEARVHPVGEGHAAKIYHEPDAERVAKLEVMVANPPQVPVSGAGHLMIAWPLDILEDPKTGEVAGYVMERVSGMRKLIDFYNPKIRQQQAPGFHLGYLLRTARNLAASVQALHEMGYVIGDLNESNVLARDTALITIVDTDSIQVTDPESGRVYRCGVGKPEYTPPEGQERDFGSYDRDVAHDRFALAVLIFQLLMEGTHPFAGTPSNGGESKALPTRIKDGLYPYPSRRDVG